MALEQSKYDIIWNIGTYPENMCKQLLIKFLKSVSNSNFNEYVWQKTDTWNEIGDINLYKLLRDCKMQYLNMGNNFFKPDPKDDSIIALTTKPMNLSDKFGAMNKNMLWTTGSGSGGVKASHKGIVPGTRDLPLCLI